MQYVHIPFLEYGSLKTSMQCNVVSNCSLHVTQLQGHHWHTCSQCRNWSFDLAFLPVSVSELLPEHSAAVGRHIRPGFGPCTSTQVTEWLCKSRRCACPFAIACSCKRVLLRELALYELQRLTRPGCSSISDMLMHWRQVTRSTNESCLNVQYTHL